MANRRFTCWLEDHHWRHLGKVWNPNKIPEAVRLVIDERIAQKGDAPIEAEVAKGTHRNYGFETRDDGTRLVVAFARRSQRDEWVFANAARRRPLRTSPLPKWITLEELRDLPTYVEEGMPAESYEGPRFCERCKRERATILLSIGINPIPICEKCGEAIQEELQKCKTSASSTAKQPEKIP